MRNMAQTEHATAIVYTAHAYVMFAALRHCSSEL